MQIRFGVDFVTACQKVLQIHLNQIPFAMFCARKTEFLHNRTFETRLLFFDKLLPEAVFRFSTLRPRGDENA